MFSDLYCSKIKEHKGTTSFKVILLMCSIWGIYQWLLAFCFSSFRTLYGPSNVFFLFLFPEQKEHSKGRLFQSLDEGKEQGVIITSQNSTINWKCHWKFTKPHDSSPFCPLVISCKKKKANVSTWVPAGLTVRDTNTCASWWHHTPKTKLAVSVDAFNSFLVLLPRTNKKKKVQFYAAHHTCEHLSGG